MSEVEGKKRVVPEHELYKEHVGHKNHLCVLAANREMDKIATLSKDAQYICHICGRAASKPKNLCEPIPV